MVTGDELVTGFNLRAQIGDGLGPQSEPVFQAINYTGGIWDVHPFTVMGGPIGGAEQYAQSSLAFNNSGDSVIADGVLATLIIDTTGIAEGTYDLKLSNTDIGDDSTFVALGGSEIAAMITNGTITISGAPLVTLIMQEPKTDTGGIFVGNAGVSELRLMWSEPVSFTAGDVTVTDELASSIPVVLSGSGTPLMSITFSVPLQYNRYTVTVHDSVVSTATSMAIDGDHNGAHGGNAVFLLEHRDRLDTDGDNKINLVDFQQLAMKWLEEFTPPAK